jgi:hypothetical protein
MRLSRIIMALTVGLAVVSAPSAAGAAQPAPPYAPGPPSLVVVPPTIVVGETTRIICNGFTPSSTVQIDVSTLPQAAGLSVQQGQRRGDGGAPAMVPVAYQPEEPVYSGPHFTVQTDAEGHYSGLYRPTEAGRYMITAIDPSGRSVSATLTVLAASPSPKPSDDDHDGGLPVTGSSLSTPLAIGGGLVGVGVVLMLAGLAWRNRGRFRFGSAR